MRFRVGSVAAKFPTRVVEINTMEELRALDAENGYQSLIVAFDPDKDDHWIQVYDGYIE